MSVKEGEERAEVISLLPAITKKRESEDLHRSFNFEVVVEASTEQGTSKVVAYNRVAEDAFTAISESTAAWRPSYALPRNGEMLRDPAEVVSLVVTARRASVHKTNPTEGTKDG